MAMVTGHRVVAQRGFAANTNGQTGQTVVFLGFCPWQGRRGKTDRLPHAGEDFCGTGILACVVSASFGTETTQARMPVLQPHYASIFFTTLPATSVKRKSRPMWW